MKKNVLKQKTQEVINDTKTALQFIFDELNQGQQKKIIKNDEVKELFDRYGVNYEE